MDFGEVRSLTHAAKSDWMEAGEDLLKAIGDMSGKQREYVYGVLKDCKLPHLDRDLVDIIDRHYLVHHKEGEAFEVAKEYNYLYSRVPGTSLQWRFPETCSPSCREIAVDRDLPHDHVLWPLRPTPEAGAFLLKARCSVCYTTEVRIVLQR